jgi:hypothetical protein
MEQYCYWDNRIEEVDKHVVISFLKDIQDAAAEHVLEPTCRVDRNFSAFGAKRDDEPQLVLVLTFTDGSTSGNIGPTYQDLVAKYGASFEGNLVTPKPGERPRVKIPIGHEGKTLASVEFQERLALDCNCGCAAKNITWGFNLKWAEGLTTGWEKVVDRGTDCTTVKPRVEEEEKGNGRE